MLRLRIATAVAIRHPCVPNAGIAAFVVGVLGAAVPTALLAEPAGAGVGHGVTWALWLFAATTPLLVVHVTAATVGARFHHGLDRELFLSANPALVSLPADAGASGIVCLGLMLPAAVGGAICGAADALARHTTLLTAPTALSLVAAISAIVWLTAVTACAVALTRSGTLAQVGVVGLFLIGIASLALSSTHGTWETLQASPLGLLTIAFGQVASSRNHLNVHTPIVLAIQSLWLLVFLAAARRRLLNVPPRSTGASY